MKSYILFAVLLVAVTVTGCGNHQHEHAATEGEHVHEENLQLTAYSNDFEVYAEATPFVAGEASDIYNPQIQISVVSGTKRSIFRQKNKTKRSKKKAAHNTYKAGAKG